MAWLGAGRNRAEGLAQVQRSRTAAAIARMLHALPVGTQRSSAATDAGRAAGSPRGEPAVDLSQPQRFAPVPLTDLRQAAASPDPGQIRSAPFLEHAAVVTQSVGRLAPRDTRSRDISRPFGRLSAWCWISSLSEGRAIRMSHAATVVRRSPPNAGKRRRNGARRYRATLKWAGELAGAAERWCRADPLACRAL
jgi:hypothetical protein